MYVDGKALEWDPRKRPEFQLGAEIADDAYGCLLSRFRKPDTAAALRAVAAKVAHTDRMPIFALQYIQQMIFLSTLIGQTTTIPLVEQRHRIDRWLSQFDLDDVRDDFIEVSLNFVYGDREGWLVALMPPEQFSSNYFATLTALGTFCLTHRDSPVGEWRREYWSMVDGMYPHYVKRHRQAMREGRRRAFKNAWNGWPNPE